MFSLLFSKFSSIFDFEITAMILGETTLGIPLFQYSIYYEKAWN